MPNYKKILIIKPSSLGDVVHGLAFLNAIRSCHPDASIHWVIAKGLEGILTDHPIIDRLWIIDKESWKKPARFLDTVKEFRKLSKVFKRERFDLVVDLQGLLRSGLLALTTGSPRRIGFEEAREGSKYCYTHRIKGGRTIHAVDRYLRIAAYLGCDTSHVHFPLDHFKGSDIVKETFQLPRKYCVIVPGARWETKRWPAERFGTVASLLPVESIVLGSTADTAIGDTVVKLSQGKARSLVGITSLKELVQIVSHAQFILTNDTGPMHIAAALNVHVFAIFGPTDPTRTGPYGKNNHIIRSNTPCAPCFKKECDVPLCLEQISAENVYETIASHQQY